MEGMPFHYYGLDVEQAKPLVFSPLRQKPADASLVNDNVRYYCYLHIVLVDSTHLHTLTVEGIGCNRLGEGVQR